MIFDPYGNLIWFKPLAGVDSASDFRVQSYHGQPVLTWWQGDVIRRHRARTGRDL